MSKSKFFECEYRKPLFGGMINIIIYNIDEKKSKGAVEVAYKEGLRLQKIFNFYDPISELSMLNKNRKMKVSDELLEVLNKALFACKLTNGKYDVSLGKNIIERKRGLKLSKIDCSYKDIEVNGNLIVLNNKDVLIDLGSIAKGYITDKIGQMLKISGMNEFVIDSRGDIIISGEFKHVIDIQHPREKDKKIESIKLLNEAVATSGDYNQFNKSFENSHILNSKNVISSTVVAPSLEIADLYATALFVSDEETRKNILSKLKEVKAMIITNDLKQTEYNNFGSIINE